MFFAFKRTYSIYLSFAFSLFFFRLSPIRVASHRQIHCAMLALRKIYTNRALFEILFAKTVRAKENRIKSNFLLKKALTKVNIYSSEMVRD